MPIQLYGSWTSHATSGLVIMLIPPVEALGMSRNWLGWSSCVRYWTCPTTGLVLVTMHTPPVSHRTSRATIWTDHHSHPTMKGTVQVLLVATRVRNWIICYKLFPPGGVLDKQVLLFFLGWSLCSSDQVRNWTCPADGWAVLMLISSGEVQGLICYCLGHPTDPKR
jgi:hypothetical protein